MMATTIGRLVAAGVGLGALLLLALASWAIARRTGAGGRCARGRAASCGCEREPDGNAAAAVERPEGGWSLDLVDDP